MLIAVHVFTVTSYHCFSQGNVAYVALRWKNTLWCRLIGGLFIISLLSSKTLTLIISLDRLILIVIKPFNKFGMSKKHIIACVNAGCIVGFIMIKNKPISLCQRVFMTAICSNAIITNCMCILVGN